MKRDARIGLAVVLVLGLAVTLLIGRALVKRGGEVADADAENAGGQAPYSAEAAHVDGAPTANISSPSNAPGLEAPETAARNPDAANPALREFINNQTQRLGVENSPANPVPAQPAGNRAPTIETPVVGPTRPIAGPVSAEPAPKADHSLLLDHEGPTPSVDTAPPSDGYGYTVAAGDNMWKISSKVYGDGKFTQKIVEANPNLNAAKMKTGAVIKIPIIQNKTVLMKLPSFAEASAAKHDSGSAVAAKESKETKKSDAPVAASTHTKAPEAAAGDAGGGEATTHKVEAGETLGTIAQKYYGASGPKSVGRIIAANKGLDPAKLKVGQELQIPAKK